MDRVANHTCHAIGCPVKVPPKLLMCRKHWFMVPKRLREAVWRHYQPGQEKTMNCSPEWHKAADAAIAAVAKKEVNA